MNSTDIQKAQAYAMLQGVLSRHPQPAGHPTGEPCRCPESDLDCTCGAITEVA